MVLGKVLSPVGILFLTCKLGPWDVMNVGKLSTVEWDTALHARQSAVETGSVELVEFLRLISLA